MKTKKLRLISTALDYADEFNYPVISVMSPEYWRTLLIHQSIFESVDIEEFSFGVNESIVSDTTEVLDLIKTAKEITLDEYKVLDNLLGGVINTACVDIGYIIGKRCQFLITSGSGAISPKTPFESLKAVADAWHQSNKEIPDKGYIKEKQWLP